MLTPVMHLRPTAALVTMDNRGGGLDQQLQLAAVLTGREQHAPWPVQHDLRGTAGSVNTHWGLLRSVAWSLWLMTAPAPLLRHHPLGVSQGTPRFLVKSPIAARIAAPTGRIR